MRQTALALAIALLAACGGSDAITGPDPVPAAAVRVFGSVLESSSTGGSGRPVSGAIVEVAGVRGWTSPDGSYSIRNANLMVGATATVVVRRGNTEVAQREIRVEQETRADFTVDALPASSLSGTVYELTAAGRVPLDKVHVENSNNHESTLSDAQGRYRLSFIEDNQATLYVNKPGYRVISQLPVTVTGDQTLDIEMVRESGAVR
ncbi:MAG TPA: carboxypeptidase-like regulatory domain-containing protein [Vicinamibacterales bacterium]|nr:carboxypeptidase-like regulatory domain-containing protein [Vicinamibacterales bacterium]